MRRVALLLGVAVIAAACAAPAPTSTIAPSIAPSALAAATPVPTPVPTTTPTVRPIPTEGVVAPDESDEPALPPLEVDWDAAPDFPAPVLVVGNTRVRSIGESGCPSLVYEPANDKMGRHAKTQTGCTMDPVLSFANAVRATAGSSLTFEAPEGWGMGAQVGYETDPYGPFWIIEANRLTSRPLTATALSAVGGDGWVQIARGEGFRLDALDALAPDAPGDYLVSVQAQVGQVPHKWRTYGRTYYYWVQVR